MQAQTKDNRIIRWVVFVLIVFGLVGVFGWMAWDQMPASSVRRVEGYKPWPKEVVKLADTLPVQDGGRIKPLSTYGGFTMLRLFGSRSMKIEIPNPDATKAGSKPFVKYSLNPTEWLMDCLYRPQMAVDFPTFRVDNSDVIKAIGLEPKGRRDRYSYRDLEAGREKLMELGKSYEAMKAQSKTDTLDAVQKQTIDLAYNLRSFESLIGYFGFARNGIHLETPNGTMTADVATVMQTAPQIRQAIEESQRKEGNLPKHIKVLLEQVLDAANFSKFGLFLLPPTSSDSREWLSAGNAIMNTMTMTGDGATAVEDIKALQDTVQSISKGDQEVIKQFTSLHTRLVSRAKADHQYELVEKEASYYRADWFMRAMEVFSMGFLAAFCTVLFKGRWVNKIATGLSYVFSLLGLACCVIAIVTRCQIMNRPPIGNLYDTIIFIATLSVVLALFVEWLTRRRFALIFGPFVGIGMILLARKFEFGEAKDHMDPLVAVLNSNYWLTIHVITITAGYAAGFVTAGFSFIYIMLRGLMLDNGDKTLRRILTRVTYGCLCFTLLLSLSGTVLGGIWANDSWGRFWGWDPKENGALMIVLWCLVMLHARLGGYIREWGLHLASIFTAAVVAFSWWHVNFFSVGLHSYGFSSEKKTALWVFYIFVGLVICFGLWARKVDESLSETEDPVRASEDELEVSSSGA